MKRKKHSIKEFLIASRAVWNDKEWNLIRMKWFKLEERATQFEDNKKTGLDAEKILKIWENYFKQISNDWDKKYAQLIVKAFDKGELV